RAVAASSLWSSISQIATTSPLLPASAESLAPLPSMPMQAKRMRSLGDFDSSARRPPATQKPTPVRAVVFKNLRRFVLVMSNSLEDAGGNRSTITYRRPVRKGFSGGKHGFCGEAAGDAEWMVRFLGGAGKSIGGGAVYGMERKGMEKWGEGRKG